MNVLLPLLLAAQVGAAADAPATYFEEGPFQPVQRLVARGAHRKAVEVLRRLLSEHPNAAQGPQARYLLGLSLIRIERYGEAARLFKELAVSYPVLKDEHLFHRARALYLWGNHLQAARGFAQVDPEGPHGSKAQLLRARALDRATDFERLARWLSQAESKQALEPELRLLWSKARRRTGDVLGAYRGYRQVWQESTEGRIAGPALAAMATLSLGTKALLPAAERSVVLGLSAKLKRPEGRFEEVLSRLDERLTRRAPRGRLRSEVAFARGRIAAKRRRFRTALAHYVRAEESVPADFVELRARIGLERGRTQEWLGQSAALATYERVASRFADRPEAEEALFRASEIQLRSRHYEEARARCEALLLDNPVSTYRRRCLWSIGWGHYRMGHYDRAREFLAALSKMDLPADLYSASRYWLARTDVQLGRAALAREGFLAVLKRQPLGYYSALANAQLVDSQSPDAPREAQESSASEALPQRLVQAREYARLGLTAQAASAAAAYERIAKAEARRIPEVAFFALSELYQELGRRRDARRIQQQGALEYPAALGSAAFLAAARRSMPMHFEEEIRSAAKAHDVPDALLFALVRTESGFRQRIVSAMNAYGLAQLILPTARQVSRSIGAGRATVSRLLGDPGYNAMLGAAYLRHLLDIYEGSEPLALAAYNAGPNAVNAWMSRRVRTIAKVKGRGLGVLPTADELAEEIPVAETRAFVKAVLARRRGYAILYQPRDVEPVKKMSWPEQGLAITEPTELPAPMDPNADLPTGINVGGRIFLGASRGAKSAFD